MEFNLMHICYRANSKTLLSVSVVRPALKFRPFRLIIPCRYSCLSGNILCECSATLMMPGKLVGEKR